MNEVGVNICAPASGMMAVGGNICAIQNGMVAENGFLILHK